MCSKMKRMIRTQIILVLSGWLLAGYCFAADTLAERNGYVLTQTDINNMLSAGEHIAGQVFTPQEQQQLQVWAVTLFQRDKDIKGVVSAFNKYAHYLDQAGQLTDPVRQRMNWHQLYREMIFQWRFPRYYEQQQTLLDIIRAYNPPVFVDKVNHLLVSESELAEGVGPEAIIQAKRRQQLIEQQMMAGVLMQSLRLNQQIFNRTMQTYREQGDNISQSMRDLSIIRSLQITGNKVLETHDDHFIIEDQQGNRHSINR